MQKFLVAILDYLEKILKIVAGDVQQKVSVAKIVIGSRAETANPSLIRQDQFPNDTRERHSSSFRRLP